MELITTADAARILQVSPERVRQLIARGRLRPVTHLGTGRVAVLLAADVERLSEERQRAQPK